jgi:hypothetical protein
MGGGADLFSDAFDSVNCGMRSHAIANAYTQSGLPEEQPLCFSSFARTGTLCWLTLQVPPEHTQGAKGCA